MTTPGDGADFNDPDAWGYCERCAFLVGKFLACDLLLTHTRGQGQSWTEQKTCPGSGYPAYEQPGPEAKPKSAFDALAEGLSDAARAMKKAVGSAEDEGD
jgi:aminoglycoside phosphotransferase